MVEPTFKYVDMYILNILRNYLNLFMLELITFIQYSVSSFLSFLWRQTSKHYCKHVPLKLHMKLFDSLYVRVNDLCAYLYVVLSVSSFLSFLWRQTSKHYCKHVPRKLHLYTQQHGYPQAWRSRLSSIRLENFYSDLAKLTLV